MVAKIIVSKNIGKALNYNEQKVQKGQAECIHAENFLHEKDGMNFYDKLERFTDLMSMNERAKTNTLHISLNFDPAENLSAQKLIKIAKSYMHKIGFGDQPYLVYQHHDAGHPHIHIVTTNIKADGSRINTHNIGRNQSETARKEIEKDFGLVQASNKHFRELNKIPEIDAQKVIYGKSETKRAITNVLDAVIKQYKYISLVELNAILNLYNVVADRAGENSRTYKTGGLFYRVLDEDGNKVGVPIKASSIYSKPTLSNLEKKFPGNEEARKPHRTSIKERIDQALEKPSSASDFVERLRKKGIETVFRQNDQGLIYGITFVDHKTKCVFNGSDLGKGYSAAAIQEKLKEAILRTFLEKQFTDQAASYSKSRRSVELDPHHSTERKSDPQSLTPQEIFLELLKAEKDQGQIPYELLKKKRKKKRRHLGL